MYSVCAHASMPFSPHGKYPLPDYVRSGKCKNDHQKLKWLLALKYVRMFLQNTVLSCNYSEACKNYETSWG